MGKNSRKKDKTSESQNGKKKDRNNENVRKKNRNSAKVQYIYIGQPPNQPRKSNFVPKKTIIGRASVQDPKCLESENLVAGNLSALEKYGIMVNNISLYSRSTKKPILGLLG